MPSPLISSRKNSVSYDKKEEANWRLQNYYRTKLAEDVREIDNGYLSRVHLTWKESRLGLRERIEIFKDAAQEIFDQKSLAREPYDRSSFKQYQSMLGIVRQEPERIEAEDVKSKVQIEDVVGRYGQLRKSGGNFTIRCLFHDDKNPSAVVYVKSQTYHCFVCSEHHDVISFIQKIEKMTFLESLNYLNNL